MSSTRSVKIDIRVSNFYLYILSIRKNLLLSIEPWAGASKSFKLVWRCTSFSPGSWPKATSPSVTSVANDKGDNEMIPGAVHRSPGICVTAEENPGISQLGDPLMKRLCDQSSPQTSSFPKNEADSTAQRVSRGKERQKERTGWNN